MKAKSLVFLAVAAGASAACSDPSTATPAPADPLAAAAARAPATLGGASAVRLPHETAEEAYARYGAERPELTDGGSAPDAGDAGKDLNAYQSRVSFRDLDFSSVPDWKTMANVTAGFDAIRDPRWIETASGLRRESWLYPDDGCFARAALADELLVVDGYAAPSKLFIFGNLAVHTPNAPQHAKLCPPWGEVFWWYHVVPVVKVGTQVMVLDPAVEPYGPLAVEDWVQRVNSESDAGPERGVRLAVCDQYTYDPYASCLHSTRKAESYAMSDEDGYLKLEWNRQTTLGRDPKLVLGASPPWKTNDWFEYDAGGCDAGLP